MLEETWPGIGAALAGIAILLFARRILPRDHARRTKSGVLMLASSIFIRLVLELLGPGDRDATVVRIAEFFDALLLGLGLSWLVDILLFDVLLQRVQVHAPRILRDIIQVAAFIALSIGLLGSAGVDLVPLLTTSAVITAVIGLALQGTLANLFAGLSLQLDRSFSIGDWIQVGTRIGRIEQIRWRSTSIATPDGDLLVVPNSTITTNEVLNFSAPDRLHRVRADVGFHYRHPPNEVKSVIIAALRGAPGLVEKPPVTCVPVTFGDSSITYAIRYWIDDISQEAGIDGEVKTRIWYAAKRAGLEIPFPIRTVHLEEHRQAPPPPAGRDLHDKVALLASIEILAPLGDSDRELLAASMKGARFGAGEPILRQGDPGDSLYLIAAGQVNVTLKREGVERQVATLGPRDFFGEMSLLTGEPRAATCSAKTEVDAFVIEHAAFRAILAAKPGLVGDISQVLGRRMNALTAEEAAIDADAARRVLESSNKLGRRIRDFFHLE